MVNLSSKALLILGAFCVLALGVWSANRAWVEYRTQSAQELADAKQLNDSTQAILARTRVERDTLKALYTATKALNGELVAAVKIKVAQRETVFIHQKIETTLHADGTRTATFKDSVAWAKLEGTVTAPPQGDLGVRYKLTRPAFEPSIGFVKSGDAYLAVVTWQGEKVELTSPYVNIPPPEPFFVPYARAAWSPFGAGLAGAGAQIKFRSLRPYAEVQAMVTAKEFIPMLWFGTTYRF